MEPRYIPKRYISQGSDLPFCSYTVLDPGHRLVSMAMVAKEIRRQNARALLKSECGGVAAEFAKRLDRADAQINHIIGPNAHKGIGAHLARLIEKAFNRPVGWLDVRHDGELLPEAEALARAYQDLPESQKEIIRGLMNTWGSPITPQSDELEEETEEEAAHH